MRLSPPAAGQRGAALAETALVVGVILIMILGSVQIGIVGYVQMTADAASYLSAHQIAVGDPNAIPATTSVFPQFNASNVSATAAPAPAPTVYVDYGYNDPNPLTRAASINNRHGGASMMEPTQLTSTVTKGGVASLMGVPLSVEGSMIEPEWLENGAHFDVANSQNYGQAGANFQENYFSNGENTPPYFVGFNYIENCPDAQPWSTSAIACSQSVQFRALGIAEHLDDSNWELFNGEVPSGPPSVTPLAFAQVACHQRKYATIAAFFANNSSLSTLQANAGAAFAAYNNALSPMNDGDYANWGQGTVVHNDGFENPALSSFISPSGPSGLAADQAIHDVYTWDVFVQSGATHSTGVGSNPFPAAYGSGDQSVGTPYNSSDQGTC